MKYLKLYENFNNNNIEDLLEDIKWIMIEKTGYEISDCDYHF